MSELKLLDPNDLHSHEAIDEGRLRSVVSMIEQSGHFYPPLLVDEETMVVLDGHHRLWASKELGCRRVPCYCVNYFEDDAVVLESWRPNMNLTKRQVIEMGLSDNVFPLKTTRHRYTIPDSIEPMPLSDLIDDA